MNVLLGLSSKFIWCGDAEDAFGHSEFQDICGGDR